MPVRETEAAAMPSAAKPSLLLRLLPSLTDMVFVFPAIWVFLVNAGASGMLEGDTGWHIRTGQWILANGRVPTQDIFSFTRPGQPWFAWEWLWDVIFASLHAHGGLTTVVLASLLVISATFVLVFRMAVRRCGSPLIAFVATLLAMMSSSIHWTARPHLFTLLFTLVFYSILERAYEGRTRLLWLLPPLTALWTNLHGGFLVGLVLIGAYALGELLRAALLPDAGDRWRSLLASRSYILAGAGCAIASFVNPYGYQLHLHIYSYLTDTTLWNRISEFLAFSFRHPASMYFEPLLVLALLAVLAAFRRGRFEHAILILFWAHAGLVSVRNIPIFAIVAAPLAAEVLAHGLKTMRWANLASWFSRLGDAVHSAIRDFDMMDRPWRLHLAGALAAALLVAVAYAPSAPERFRARYDPKEFPVKAAAELNDLMAGSRVFTDDEWGDYLIYRNYPAVKVFIDGRSDFYGVEFGKTYDGIVAVSHVWEKSLNTYGVDVVLLRVKFALAGVLKESARWRVVYDDGTAIAFRRSDSMSPPAEQVSGDRIGGKRGRVVAN